MGNAMSPRQAGAAQITHAGYTHPLPEDMERASETLSVYLAKRRATKARGE
jgi:hypothetical protein